MSEFLKTGENGPAVLARSSADEIAPTLKMFERQDWTLFRTIDGLQQKAGVPAARLCRLVLKELADNALDAGEQVDGGLTGGASSNKYFIEDNGPGLDGTPQEIAELFSIKRPMRSTKLLRLPQRGALGNGLRVVAGAVLASQGSLAVITRNRRIILQPQADGHTAVVEVTTVDRPIGTRVEIGFGPALPSDVNPFAWVRAAQAMMATTGKSYEGRTSPYWYDAAQFHELLLACGAQPLRSLVAELDGCSGGKAGDIVAAAALDRVQCQEVDRQQAVKLLVMARKQTRPVSPDRLGSVGRDAFDGLHYAVERGTAELGSVKPLAQIPFVIEAWATKKAADRSADEIAIGVFINRTPTASEVSAWRDGDKDICVSGNGLENFCSNVPKTGGYDIKINVTTPYCPITSDGKAPNLEPFVGEIIAAIETATRKAQRAAPKDKQLSQKDVVLDNLDDVIAEVSGDGQFRFNPRQLLYRLRPLLFDETGTRLNTANFNNIITDHENENGEIPGMYREPRGSIYHPHRRETIPLGTLTVEDYERPIWTYNKLVHIEKEGFSEALKEVDWAERHDCALTSTKGYTTRAIRDLVDELAEHDEPVTVFLVTDADAYGATIYQTFQEATKARGARKIKIVHLGLHPWEAVEDGLEVEDVPQDKQRKPVARYVLEREDGDYWEEWLQSHRIELNVMTTPEFIKWLDQKMAEHGVSKLIPPEDVIATELEQRLDAKVRGAITERVLRQARFEQQVAKALAKIKRPSRAALTAGIKKLFARNPENEWRAHIERLAAKLGVAE